MSKRLTLLMLTAIACVFATRCSDIGTGGTGEMVVPQKDLREIKAVEATDIAREPSHPVSTLPSTRSSTQPLAEVPLTLAQVREMALRNNLDLKVSLISPSLARESLNAEEAKYEALFTTDFNYSSTDAAVANVAQQAISGTQAQTWNLTPGLVFPLRTGGVINVNTPMTNSDVNGSANQINPEFTSDFAVSISQPLLRGGGIDVNAQPIRVAFYGYQQAQARTKLEVIRVLADADRVYWRLYAAREDVRVRRQEYDLAVAQLERARRQVRAGSAAEVEIVRAESGVADRVEAIITSENTLRDRERELKRMLNSPDLDMQSPTTIITSTAPRPIYLELDVPNLVARSMQQRMELLDTELQIAEETANVRVARHETLPLVTLNYQYNVNSLSGSFDDPITTLARNDFDNHFAGLKLEVPIGNEAAKSHLRQALLSRLQQLVTLEQKQLQIRQEVLTAADQLEANWQRILAARERVVLSKRLLEVEIRQFEQGLRTSTEVLNAQTDLSSAQLSEVSATSDYQIAQVDIAFATGTILGASNILWDPTSPPKR